MTECKECGCDLNNLDAVILSAADGCEMCAKELALFDEWKRDHKTNNKRPSSNPGPHEE